MDTTSIDQEADFLTPSNEAAAGQVVLDRQAALDRAEAARAEAERHSRRGWERLRRWRALDRDLREGIER